MESGFLRKVLILMMVGADGDAKGHTKVAIGIPIYNPNPPGHSAPIRKR